MLGSRKQVENEQGAPLEGVEIKNVDEVTTEEFGGDARVELLKQLFTGLQRRKDSKFYILSRGRETRIKVALERVGLLGFFAAPGMILASDSENKPAGFTKGEQIGNLL